MAGKPKSPPPPDTIHYPWWYPRKWNNFLVSIFLIKIYEITSLLTLRSKFKKIGKNVQLWKLQYLHQPGIMHGLRYVEIGDNVCIRDYSYITAIKFDETVPYIYIGDNTTFGMFSHISATGRIIIEKNVLAADKVYISDNLHEYQDITKPVTGQPVIYKKEVVIGEGSWLGEHVTVLCAKIGKNCVIGSNSVVTKDIPDFSVAVGVPARVIKRYDPGRKEWRKTGPDGSFA
jgi:acetyltransferase-like isoleucine patch superfamily enzyme